jgi:hypothetical protein
MSSISAGSPPREPDPPAALGPVVVVPLDQLRPGGSPRCTGARSDHVRLLAEADGEWPPIIVHRPSMRIIDGLHRWHAARLRGDRSLPVRFFDGGAADAFVLAVRVNSAHGLPLSAGERRAAAARILVSHPLWSDRMVASVTGLSARTVATVRRAAPPAEPPAARVGRDGRARPVDRLAKRRSATELMRRDPDLSLRQVARAVGISPETARAVRAELHGERPRPAPRPVGPVVGAEDWSVTVRRLRDDPALRFSETGRALLRLLDLHTMSTDRWTAIVRTVPAYNRPTVAKVAMECARVWRLVAAELAAEELAASVADRPASVSSGPTTGPNRHGGGTSDARYPGDHVVSVADPGRAAGQRRALGGRPGPGGPAHP